MNRRAGEQASRRAGPDESYGRSASSARSASGSLVWLVFLASLAFPSCHPAPSPRNLEDESAGRATLTVANDTDVPTTVYAAFGSDSVVLPANFSSFCDGTSLNCSFSLAAHSAQSLPLAGRYINATFSFDGQVTCGMTKAEVNLNNPRWYDILDVSLVDGFSAPVKITAGTIELGPARATGNEKALGVFPNGCDICVARQKPPCGMSPGKDGCKSGTQYKPDVPCQWQGTRKGGSTATRVALVP